MQKLVVLTGPTSVGKTKLSIDLAKAIGGEIISADSMQVYKYMDIGSAKIMPNEMDGVTHYLVDVLDPRDDFNVFLFQKMAKEAIDTIISHGNIPILVGGTGFYIQAVLYDIAFSETEDDTTYRKELESLLEQKGATYLHHMLESIDPQSALDIHANNSKRVIRAIEYYKQTGQLFSVHNREERQKESKYDFNYFVLNCDRKLLYENIDKRVDIMLETGLVDEVKKLKEMGLTRDHVSMQGLGYKEILDYLDGKITLDEAVYLIKRDTRHFAKRQLTWFRREKHVEFINKEDFSFDSNAILAHMISKIQ